MKIFGKEISLNNTKIKKYSILGLGLFFFYFATTNSVLASDTTSQAGEYKGVLEMFELVMKMFSVLLGIATSLIGALMSPEWTTGSVIGLNTQLKDLWIMFSNVVYFVFAFLFVYIAVMNIIGKGGEYELKQALPRFIISILIVPFSWFIVQFIISLSGVLTVAVISIPYDTISQKYLSSTGTGAEICKNVVITISTGSTDGKAKEFIKCADEKVGVTNIIDPTKSSSLYGIMNIYTYGVMGLDDKFKLYTSDLSLFEKPIEILTKFGFDIVFSIVYCILLVGIFMVLFVRGFRLWIFAAASPIFGLMNFFKKAPSGALKNFSLIQFIKLALMPVYVGAVLAFGLLFIYAVGQANITNNTYSDPNPPETDTPLAIYNNGKSISTNGMNLTIEGLTTGKSFSDGIAKLGGSLGNIIIQLLGIGILWAGLVAAMKSSDITASVAQPFEQIGNQIGGLIKKAPTYTPIIPTSQGMQSMSSLSKVSTTIAGLPETMATNKASGLQQSIRELAGLEGLDEKIINGVKQAGKDGFDKDEYSKYRKELLIAIEKFGFNNPDVKRMFSEFKTGILNTKDATLKADFGKSIGAYNKDTKLDDTQTMQVILGSSKDNNNDANQFIRKAHVRGGISAADYYDEPIETGNNGGTLSNNTGTIDLTNVNDAISKLKKSSFTEESFKERFKKSDLEKITDVNLIKAIENAYPVIDGKVLSFKEILVKLN